MTFNTIFKLPPIALVLMSTHALAVAPVVTSNAITSATEDSAYTYAMSATDSDDDLLTWGIADGDSLPSWLSLVAGGNQTTIVANGLNRPLGIATDDDGNVYATNYGYPYGVTKVAPDGTKTIFVDTVDEGGYALEMYNGELYMSHYRGANQGTIVKYDSVGNKTEVTTGLNAPIGMSFYNGTLYVSDYSANTIVAVNLSDGSQSLYATPTCNPVWGIAFDNNGDLLAGCYYNENKVVKIASGVETDLFTVPGNPSDMKVDKNGNYYVAATGSTGSGVYKYSPTLERTDIQLNMTVYGIAQNSSGTLYFSDFSTGDLHKLETGAVLSGTPTNDDVGDHPVALSVNDGTGNVENHNFVITVANTNDAPVADSQVTVEVSNATPIDITVTGSDIDPTNDVLSFSIHSQPSGGALSQSGDHNEVITYTANDGFSGADSFEFVANDTMADSAPVTINLNVSLNSVPIISGAQAGQSVTDTTTVTPFSNISLSDSDGDNITLTIGLDDNNKGTLSGTGLTGTGPYTLTSDSTANVQAVLRALIFMPVANRVLPSTTETTTFTLVANDATEDSAPNNTTTVVSTSVNDSAIISGDFTSSIIEDSGTSATGTVSISDIDAGQTPSFVVGDTVGTYGTLTLDLQGNWSYALDNTKAAVQALSNGATMTDIITISAVDGTQKLVTITITGVNGEATIRGISTGAVIEDDVTVVTGDLTVDDEDAGQAVFVTQTDSEGSYGFFSLTLTGTWSYQLDGSNLDVQILPEGETLTDNFTVNSIDGTDSQIVTITITGINDVATITGTSIADTNEDNTAQITGSLSITDKDTGEAIFMMQSGVAGAYGIFNIDNQGDWTFTLDNDNTLVQQMSSGEQLTDSFTAMSIDGSDSQTITVTVFGANDAPHAEYDETTVDVSVNGVYVIDVLGNDSDVDGDALSIVGANTSLGSVSTNGESLTLTTQTGFVGQIALTYTITDGNNAFSETTVNVEITGALNETAPVITVPETVEVNAEGLYTKVDLGVATALNSQGQPVPISLVDGEPLFKPGNSIAYWQAIDPKTGLTTVASQEVIVHPIISLGKDQVVVEGKKVSVDIILNGEAPTYPVVIALSISGSVDENDYAIETQEITIDSGTQTSVLINIVQDNTPS